MWVSKTYNHKIQQEYSIKNKICDIKGVEHHLEIFLSDVFSQIAKIDDRLYLQSFLKAQSEFLAHIGVCSYKETPKRVLVAGSFNLELAYELLKYDFLETDFLQFDLKVLESLVGFFPHFKEVMEHKRFHHIPQTNKEFLAQNEERAQEYDIIFDFTFRGEFQNILAQDGIMIAELPHLLLDLEGAKQKILDFKESFRVKMPFVMPLSQDFDNCYLLASKKYHPTADIALQRADMLEDLEFYQPLLHQSAFVLPKGIKNALNGIVKN
ncbi:spermidine synthase [Helicobacter burdigaliensis]|uniref:spermine/spermidine synthase domain-containing protein n=1 Tax=Helicobacter burdigaliensis TaxID=2315334 RepID=UPI000EF67064|nr:spermidine synthase [Helicobacter burdigaliensis]